MSTLAASEIRRRIRSTQNDALVITPLLNEADQVRGASVDVRLGNYFISFVRGKKGIVDPKKMQDISDRYETNEEIYVPYGRNFILHPRQFVVGGTLEYFGLPKDLAAYVVGRSSWGRLGLVVATAIGVHPGYRGIITLELTNLGEVPILLYPGWSIAQVFFQTIIADANCPVEGCDVDNSRYSLAVKPEMSRLVEPEDLRHLEEAINKRGGLRQT
ncbi:MAG: dCTP deaminase [Chloroflexi bacterium]|nr:dCTP deaminase [Chloroflexota bacterium]